jgi:enterochelin esterase-like enzyme
VPDLDLNGTKDADKLAAFLIEVLLPRIRRELPISAGPESTGIDGVSLGGALALRIGLAHPETFGVVGALQPAIGDERLSELTDLALAARAKRPKMPLRLTTSHDDYYKPWVTKLSERWKSAGISHDFADVPGPHDYVFNRGPGVYEMLFWQDRALV